MVPVVAKMMALALAMVMVLAMSATVFAAPAATAPKGTIEITSPKTDPNADNTYYDAYRIFDMTTNGTVDNDGNYTAVAYTINSAWANFFATGAPGAAYLVDTNSGDLNSITVNDATKYINITDSNVATFAKEAFDYAQKNSIAATKTETVAKDATTAKFTDLDLGYYMVYPRGASVQSGDYTSIVSITNTAPDGKVAQKAEWPGLTKVADDISTEVGQKVTYTLGSKVPDTTGYTKYEFTFKDKTTAGLTYDGNDSVTVKIGGTTLAAGTDYTFAASPSDGNDFELTINLLKNNGTTAAPEWVAKYTYDAAIEITYTATGRVVPGWSSSFIGTTLIGGIQLISLGVIGEYVGKIYMETKGRPRYIVETHIGLNGVDNQSEANTSVEEARKDGGKMLD